MKSNTKKLKWILSGLFFALALTFVFSVPVSAASGKTVATIGKKSYTSLESAFKAVKNGQTIKLKKNVKLKKGISIKKKGAKITLNLNGKTLKCSYTGKYVGCLNLEKGTLTIKNGTMKQTNDDHMIYVDPKATLKLTSGTYKGTIENYYGKIKITGKKVKFKNSDIFNEHGTLSISKGTFTNTQIVNCRKGTATIKGSTFKSTKSNDYSLIYNNAKMTISGGTFKSTKGQMLFGNSEKGTLTIKKATANYKGYKNTCCRAAMGNFGGKLKISGGTYTTNMYLLHVNDGTATISGGTFKCTGNKSYTMLVAVNDAVIKVNGGTYKAKNAALYCYQVNGYGYRIGTVKLNSGNFNAMTRMQQVLYTVFPVAYEDLW